MQEMRAQKIRAVVRRIVALTDRAYPRQLASGFFAEFGGGVPRAPL